MNLKDFPYKTSFSAEIKCLVSSNTDHFLSIASLENLKFLLPQYFIDQQGIDLLPVCFNAAVVNRCNKNGDSIDTATAINICKSFIHRPTDIDHSQTEICGHIINAGYTQFNTDKELSEDQVKTLVDPFNIALASYVYARAYPDLADAIEESADPDSLKFKSISASWELLFKSYKIVKGSKNLSEAKIIDDPDESKDLEKFLQVNNGTGKDKGGNNIYRLISGEVYAAGIGYTRIPAAEVKGIYVPGITDKELKASAANINISNNLENNKEIISILNNINVNKTDMKQISNIEDFKALTDETLKECKASSLVSVVADELAKISEKLSAEKKEKDAALTSASEISVKLSNVEKELEKMKSAAASKEIQDTFNVRMASLDETYKLDDKLRGAIAKQIKDLDEVGFTTWASDFELFAADKKKSKADIDDDESEAAKKDKVDKEAKAKKDKEDKDKEDKEKSDKDKTDADKKKSMAHDARALLDGIKVTQASLIPNTSSTSETLLQKYASAFNKETVTVKQRR